MRKRYWRSGFTLPEIIVTMGIVTILFSIAAVPTYRTINNTAVTSVYESFTADLKAQQMKAMEGSSLGGNLVNTWGVKIFPDRYELFAGNYAAGSGSNVVITVPDEMTLNSDASNGEIKFSRLSGEVEGLTSGNLQAITFSQSGQQKILRINRYGKVVAE